MKIKADQLTQQLAKAISPVYLISGDEPLIVEDCGDAVRAQLKKQGFNEREVLHVETGFKWEYLLECANALSLFAENRLIEIRLGSQKVNKAAAQIIQEYVAHAPAENVLLIIADKLDAGAKKTTWYKAIESKGIVVEIWPVESNQLPAWLKQQALSRNIQLNNDAIQMLCERIEGNLLAAKQELDKLQLLQGSGPLTAEDILAAVSDSSRYDVFALIDAIIANNTQRSLKILDVLKHEGVETTIILWAISREIRLLYSVKSGLNQGVSFDSLCTKHRIWGKKKFTFKQAAMKQSFTTLEAMLRQSAQADQIIKGMQQGDAWLLITDMVIALSGTQLQLSE